MKFALVDEKKTLAKQHLIGKCRVCGNAVKAYCGKLMVHHWKHITLRKCDNWYERETEWHREWKNKFDISYQEIIKFDSQTGEKHIADIYNENKHLVIEFQHSPIKIEEIKARELFYGKMIWVIDLISTKSNLTFFKNKSEIEDILLKMRHNLPKDFQVSDDFRMDEAQLRMKDIWQSLGLSDENFDQSTYISELEENYVNLCKKKNYLLMTWKRRHKRWDFGEKTKFIDIGNDYIYQIIERIEIGNAYVVKRYLKEHFVNYYQ